MLAENVHRSDNGIMLTTVCGHANGGACSCPVVSIDVGNGQQAQIQQEQQQVRLAQHCLEMSDREGKT